VVSGFHEEVLKSRFDPLAFYVGSIIKKWFRISAAESRFDP
jgi:hypothetical protein